VDLDVLRKHAARCVRDAAVGLSGQPIIVQSCCGSVDLDCSLLDGEVDWKSNLLFEMMPAQSQLAQLHDEV
jgi:hypothetical protein